MQAVRLEAVGALFVSRVDKPESGPDERLVKVMIVPAAG
jgi:hypothetical protein